MKIKKIQEIEPTVAPFELKNYIPIPKSAVTIINSRGGIGKTRLLLLMADRLAREGKKSVLWLTEDYAGQVKNMFNEFVKAKMVEEKSQEYINLILDTAIQLAKVKDRIFTLNVEAIDEISDTLLDLDVSMFAIDPLLAFYGGNENDNSQASIFMLGLNKLAQILEIPIVVVHHSNKSGESSRGASAFHDGCRARYQLDYIKTKKDGELVIDEDMLNKGIRLLTVQKDNWGLRKYFWTLSDGVDYINIKIAPKIGS